MTHIITRDYADIAEVITIGRSVEGRQILGIKIAANMRSERPLLRPQVKFSANIHGDEAVCREMLIGLARCRLLKLSKYLDLQAVDTDKP